MKEYWKGLTPEQKEARLDKQWEGRRAAKKKAYAASKHPEAHAAEEKARAEARAAEQKARADAFDSFVAQTPLTEEEIAASRESRVPLDAARRRAEALARDMDLQAKGPAGVKKAKKRKANREAVAKYSKRKRLQKELCYLGDLLSVI